MPPKHTITNEMLSVEPRELTPQQRKNLRQACVALSLHTRRAEDFVKEIAGSSQTNLGAMLSRLNGTLQRIVEENK